MNHILWHSESDLETIAAFLFAVYHVRNVLQPEDLLIRFMGIAEKTGHAIGAEALDDNFFTFCRTDFHGPAVFTDDFPAT